MHTHTTNCCPDCGRVADKETKGSGGGTQKEIVSNVQMTADQIKDLKDRLKTLQSDVNKSIDDALSDSEVSDVLSKTRDALISMSLDDVDDDQRAYGVPSTEFITARNNLRSELERLQNLLEAEYIDGQRSGRPTVRQWISATTPMQQLSIFRRHIADEVDETGIEVVGLLDQSGSMGGIMDHASQATWSIASAVRMTGNQSTMIGFDDQARILIGRKQKLSAIGYPRFGVMGGTDPQEAIDLAERVFAETDMPNRLLYIVTDGEWADPRGAADKVKQLRSKYNVDSVLITIDYRDNDDKRGCDYRVDAEDPAQMCAAVSRIIVDISRRCATRIANETNREA
jgi:uncharacterized protein with von Willebrand factor type A (vWA) domain